MLRISPEINADGTTPAVSQPQVIYPIIQYGGSSYYFQ
jgi:hypothetical protein